MFDKNGLSERELEILQLVATGASNKEIASRLVISPNTVKVHLRNIFAKIDVVSRTEATLYAIRIGLIQPESEIRAVYGSQMPIDLVEENLPEPEKNRLRYWPIGLGIIVIGLIVFFIVWPAVFPDTNAVSEFPAPESRWTVLDDLPDSRSGMAGVFYEGIVYLIGGENDDEISGSVLAYDSSQHRWESKAEKPTPVTAAGAALLGEKIYIPGGMTTPQAPTNVLEIYDPRTNQWESGASMPVALGGYSLVPFEGKLILFGGWDGADYSSRILMYDPAEDRWIERAGMKEPRAFASAAMLGSKIVLAGGQNREGVLDRVSVYYPNRTDEDPAIWEPRAALPQPRQGGGMTALAGTLYLAGGTGERGETSLPLIRYDEGRGAWEEGEVPPVTLGYLPAVIPLDTQIHILGGEIDGKVQPTHIAYQAIYTVLIPAITR